MKVRIGKYQTRLTCNLHKNYMEKTHGFNWPAKETTFERFLERIDDCMQDVYNVVNRAWFDRREQVIRVHIDPWDTWSMDHTLAHIIIPMLKQLKHFKHGAPYTDPKDTPEHLVPIGNDEDGTDNTHFERWDWILDEMIWAFEQKTQDWESQYFGGWIEDKNEPLGGGRFEAFDSEGLTAHQNRMSNGFRLFGKYYEGLWD